MPMEEYLTTPMFSPSRTVGSPPASDAFRMSSHVATLGSSLRPPLFTADAPSNGSPVRPVYPLGLHLPSTGGVAPAWASGLAGIALERPGSAVALPVDSKEQVLSMSMQSKLHAFQCGLDNQAHLIKQLRREVDGKQETVEATRAAETVAALTQGVRELARVVETKAPTDEVQARLDELAGGLSRTLDAGEINARFLRVPTKAELTAEVSTRASLHDTKSWLGAKADAAEVERAFDRQHAQVQAIQMQMDTSLASEMDARRQALVLLRESMMSELACARGAVEQKATQALEELHHSLHEGFQLKMDAVLAREAKARHAELASMQESMRMELHTQEKTLSAQIAGEVNKRQAAAAALREVMEEHHKAAVEEPKAAHALARALEEIADLKAELSHALGKKVDNTELAALADNVPTKAEVAAELNRKPSVAELHAALDDKADRADVKSFFERQSGAWASLQEKVDSGLAAEAEARRKGDGAARELVLHELEGFKHDLEQIRSVESQQAKQELAHMHNRVTQEMSVEANARCQALEGLRKLVSDELVATQKSLMGKLEKNDTSLAGLELMVPKLERAAAMLKEDVRGERDSREALKMSLNHGLEVVGKEVEAITAEAHRAEKRLRADVDHSLQQLSGELETESELRVKRCAEITSSASQLQSQVDELATSGARTRSLVMEEAVEKLNAVRREVDTVHMEMASRPTKGELKAALDTAEVAASTATKSLTSTLAELREQTERWEEADRVEHAAAKTALTEGLRKLKDGLRSELHQMIDQSEAAFAQSEEAAAKAKAEAHADVEKARRELAVAVQTVADAVEAECASRRTELTAAMNSEAEARKRALSNVDAAAEAESKAQRAATEEVGHRIERTAAELRDELARESRARHAAAADAHTAAAAVVKALEGKLESRLTEQAATATQRDDDLLKQVEARAPNAVVGEVVAAACAGEKQQREAALAGVHAEFMARLLAEARAREVAVDRLEEFFASRSRAAALDVRTEMVADTATRFDALKAQVSGLDHKLGSLLIDEELKMKDSLFHSLKSLKEELSHDIFDTQERVDTLMRMLEDKADVSEVTDHLLDIQRAVAAKADRAEKNKVKAKARTLEYLVSGVPTGYGGGGFPPPLRGTSARKAPWKGPDPASKGSKK